MRTLLLSATLIVFSCGSTSGKDGGSGGGLSGTGGGFIGSGGGSSAGGSSGGGAAGGSSAGGSTAGGATGGGSTSGGSAGGGSTAGGSAGGSTGMPGVVCGSSTCSGATPTCCGSLMGGILGFSCQSACPDAGAAWECDEPADCNGDAGTPFCCAVMDLGPGSFPVCPAQSLSSSCRATCTTNVGLTCPTGGNARVCSHATDCPSAQKCCAFTQGSQTIQVCVSGSLPCSGIP